MAATAQFTTPIVDDERWSREKIRRHLANVPWLRVVGEADDTDSALRLAEDLRPDLLFLDIEMPGGSGMNVVSGLPHRPAVIFTTAYSRYAVSAFEVRGVDYLLKPFGGPRLDEALRRAREVLETRTAPATDVAVPEPLTRLFIRRRGRIVPVAVDRIVRFEALDDYVKLHTDEGRWLASVRMRELDARLDSSRFLRIHRSHIVNLEYVVGFAPHASGRLRVELQDGTRLFVSRARSRALRRHAV